MLTYRETREMIDHIEYERRKLMRKTNQLLDALMKQPNVYGESIMALIELQRILDFFDFWRFVQLMRPEMRGELESELSSALEHLEKIRRIEITQGSVRGLNAFSEWDEQKKQFLSCAEAGCQAIRSKHPMLSDDLPSSAPADPPPLMASRPSIPWPSSPPSSSAHKPKPEKESSWLERLFKRKPRKQEEQHAYMTPPMTSAPSVDEHWKEGSCTGYAGMPVMNIDLVTASVNTVIAAPEPLPVTVDQVFFTAVAPKRFLRDEATEVSLLMYEDAFQYVVQQIRDSYDCETAIRGTGMKKVERGTRILVTIDSPEPGVVIEDDTQEEVWSGKYLEFHFWVRIPADLQKNQVKLNIQVYTGDIRLTTLSFYVKCTADAVQQITPQRWDVRSAFVSYAREDLEEVSWVIQGMEKVRPDLELFMDLENLRSGQNWQAVLKHEIEKRDLLYLCWSPDAKRSEWVDFEWRHMFRQRGIAFIDPIPMESPKTCPPPAELSSLHFDERWLRYRKRKESQDPVRFYIKNHSNGQITPIRKSSAMIGREAGVDVCLRAGSVSRHHLMIEVDDQRGFRVRDLNSEYGSFLEDDHTRITSDGITVKRGTKLRLADEIVEIL